MQCVRVSIFSKEDLRTVWSQSVQQWIVTVLVHTHTRNYTETMDNTGPDPHPYLSDDVNFVPHRPFVLISHSPPSPSQCSEKVRVDPNCRNTKEGEKKGKNEKWGCRAGSLGRSTLSLLQSLTLPLLCRAGSLGQSTLVLHFTFEWKFVYYESMKRKIQIKPINECRCDGRLQTKRFTRLSYTGLVVELEHLKIKTRLTNEKFASVKGECEV